jgi:hypothetical protein
MPRRRRFLDRGSNRQNQSKPRGLRVESLEGRQMMAVFPTGGTVGTFNEELVEDPGPPPGYISVVNEFNLNSKPGAPATLFLDFNGHYQTESVGDWHGIGGWDNILTPAYDRDGDPLTYSPDEQQEMRFIWATVAEDYAPFNINVTTVDPDPGRYHTDDPYLRVVVSGGSDTITGRKLAGFAETGAYADDGGANVAYVFTHAADGSSYGAKFIADSASHEAGHSFGLEHQSQYNSQGRKVKEYRPGNGERGPIMGSVASFERGTWSKGPIGPGITLFPYSGYIATQDDMAVIARSANGFGYRSDDIAGSMGGSRQLTSTNAGLFGRGIIEKTSDTDMFRFTTGGGNVSVDLQLPQERIRPGQMLRNIGNLDATLRLYNSSGVLIAQAADPATLTASLSASVGAGTYYVRVGSQGVYGDVGQYTLLVKETSGPQIVSSQYTSLSATLGGLLVTFNEPISANTFTVKDVRINGGIAGAGVVSIGAPTNGSRTFLITFTKPGTVRTTISIGPNINDLFGNRMDQNGNGLTGEAADAYSKALYLSPVVDGTTGTLTETLSGAKSTTTVPSRTSRSADLLFAKY